MVAQFGRGSLGAYVISMCRTASDILAVELLQREGKLLINEETGNSRLLKFSHGTVTIKSRPSYIDNGY